MIHEIVENRSSDLKKLWSFKAINAIKSMNGNIVQQWCNLLTACPKGGHQIESLIVRWMETENKAPKIPFGKL